MKWTNIVHIIFIWHYVGWNKI